jgi:hypothetical protein
VYKRKAEGSEPREGMLLRSRMLSAGEPLLSGGSTWYVRDDTVDLRDCKCVVRSAVKFSWMRILPERDDDDLSGVRVSDGNTVAAAW